MSPWSRSRARSRRSCRSGSPPPATPRPGARPGQIGANVLTHLLGQTRRRGRPRRSRIYHAGPARGRARSGGLHGHADAAHLPRRRPRGGARDRARADEGLPALAPRADQAVRLGLPGLQAARRASTAPMQIDLAGARRRRDGGDPRLRLRALFRAIRACSAPSRTPGPRVESSRRIGVDEVACLIDYGIAAPDRCSTACAPWPRSLRRANDGSRAEDDWSIAAQIVRHGVTHLQCTPSMARMLVVERRGARRAVARQAPDDRAARRCRARWWPSWPGHRARRSPTCTARPRRRSGPRPPRPRADEATVGIGTPDRQHPALRAGRRVRPVPVGVDGRALDRRRRRRRAATGSATT